MIETALMGLCPDCLVQAGFGTLDPGPDAAGKPPFVPPTPKELARFFPGLEIIELIGRGGMGAVYKARQKRLERLVALKILPPGVSQDTSFADRFEREAKALAQLHHPNIVTVYDSGQTDGLFYFFMELVDGVNLRQTLDTGLLSPARALAIVPQICDALQFAHDRGIIHRDIKPENILLNKEGQVKIADFGVAKIVGREPSKAPNNATEAGRVIGTPQYMAPEQLSHAPEVDNRADIYALGVVFYEMLTGELPAGKFEPPSQKVQIDVRLDEVVLRAMEKKPELRYQQASVMKTQVETIASTPEAGMARVAPESPQRSGTKEAVSSPRFSRKTVIGACWAGAGLVTVLLTMLCWHFYVVNQSRTNSLGMKFVPAGTDGVLFSVWDVRVKDFRAFVDATGYDATGDMTSLRSDGWKKRGDTWKNPGFTQTENDPVVGVSGNDAIAFCQWLTEKERTEGKLAPNQEYRLPTNAEWDSAIGPTLYPWGNEWPPPPRAGNYAGDEAKYENWPKWSTLENYDDGYPRTSPVGSFKPNVYGLYDMGGNVWQLCTNNWALRGASWSRKLREELASSSESIWHTANLRADDIGFRIVLVVSPGANPQVTESPAPETTTQVTEENSAMNDVANQSRTNSLGVKFVPAGTDGVLFSVWDVRVKDFQAFVNATGYNATGNMQSIQSEGWRVIGDTWKNPGFSQTEDDPVVGISGNDAQAFCLWLTMKERAEGKLTANQEYRLPTNAEWSKAVGSSTLYPWGDEWPPPPGAGNYAGIEARDAKWWRDRPTIEDYSDGYSRTSPVGSFKPNAYGLYDMGGNVCQWCQDDWALRGASWSKDTSQDLLSSDTWHQDPNYRRDDCGFRIVLVTSPTGTPPDPGYLGG
ncbi:MAG TPA: bifunctional serine/threonine-protein kinase/formylglycine-generating enzyme family protein [Candidatus Methylacidiphilales bacterium]|nr:bifunctional serine/threonine-protein kinase/formylglycine-generating enzyme family protein [Candidatus Methylacidiphilales bacterium]